jgi:hypothetical protein
VFVPLVIVLTPTVMPADEMVAHVLSPRRKLLAFAVPVADRLLVPMAVNDAPEPLNVVAVAVPLIFNAPLNVDVPMATLVVQVEDTPATVPVRVGAADRTTFPDPVEAVVQAIAVPDVAVQKSFVVKVPMLVVRLEPIAIQLVELQYAMAWLLEL